MQRRTVMLTGTFYQKISKYSPKIKKNQGIGCKKFNFAPEKNNL